MSMFRFHGGGCTPLRMSGIAIAACVMTSTLTAGTIPIPLSQQGQGAVEITTGDNSPGFCATGFGFARIGNSCSLTATTPGGSAVPGTMSGTGTAYTDAAGLHASVLVGSSGYGYNTGEAEAGFRDTITNNTNVTANFKLGFEVDAILTNIGGGAYDYLTVQFWHGSSIGSPFQIQENDGVFPAPDGALQTWSYSGNAGAIDVQDATSAITIAPHASYTFSLSLDADAQTLLEPGQTNLGGAPEGIVNALNTMTITSFSAQDTLGNPLPVSDFSSADGTNYAGTAPAVPEPATFGTCGAVLLLLGVYPRRRRLKAT